MHLHEIFPSVPAPILATVAQRAEQEGQRSPISAKAAARRADERYGIAKTFADQLTSEQKIELAMYLVDAADYDAPDLRTETESCLSDILAAVRGEV